MVLHSAYRLRIPEVPLHEAVLINMGENEEDVALVEAGSGSTYTYHQVAAGMEAVGSALTKHGVQKGDVIAFYAPNSCQYAIGILACVSVGAVFTGVNSSYTPYELGHHLADSKATCIVTVAANVSTIRKALDNDEYKTDVKMIITLDSKAPDCLYFADLLADDGSSYPHGRPFNVYEDLAAILYSSGTTGLPKGVMLTHYNMVCNIYNITSRAFRPPAQVPVVMGFLPLFHAFGVSVFLAALKMGGRTVMTSGFKPEGFLDIIQTHKINLLYVVPPIVLFLAKSPLVAKYDISSVQMVFSSAAPLTKDTEEDFLSRFKLDAIYQGYGMTEATSSVALLPHGKPCHGSSGILIPNTSVKIIDLKAGESLVEDQEGEILIKGPQLMKGYLNNQEATKAAIDQEGWLHSGDVGYYNKDGYLFISGRIKELIKHKGFQVSPAEVEGLIMRHPGVIDTAVIGVPDEAAGELPRAFVVRRPNYQVTEQEICDFVKEHLSRHKWLTGGVQFVDSIPKTPSGKIIRSKVQKLNEVSGESP